ncbi:MAG: YitT family protein [Clostridia bacterium]|nr:YitT family protein [Clostridia bacterium]
MKEKIKNTIIELFLILAGCALTACGLVMFTIPNMIAPGGTSGLATALAEFIPISVGLLTWLCNVPILIASVIVLGKQVTVKALLASTALSVLMEVMDPFLPKFTDNPLCAAVLGGILIGAGVGTLFLKGNSMGSTDLLSVLLGRLFPNLSSGNILMVCDGAVVIIAAIIFKDLNTFLYSIITVAVASKAVDVFLDGFNSARVIFIITDKGKEICDRLNLLTRNGCTLMNGLGTYTGKEKNIIMTVVRPNTCVQTLETAKKIDRKMFAFICSAAEVHGKGFSFYNAEGMSSDNR